MKKRVAIVVILAIVFAIVVAGACAVYYGDWYTYWPMNVLTLKDFDEGDSQQATSENVVVVAFWQGPAEIPAGEPIAVIPYVFSTSVTRTFCWEVGAETYDEHMILYNDSMEEVLRLDAGSGCVMDMVLLGAYEMRFYRDDTASQLPIFIRPDPDIVYRWDNRYSGVVPSTFIITTNVCVDCILAGGDFYQANFEGCDFTGAVFASADLSGANLTNAVLTNTVFDDANLSLTTWTDGTVCAEGSVGACRN